MGHPASRDEGRFERYRNYLRLLARMELPAQLQSKVDPSDLVQQTLMKAHTQQHQLTGASDAEEAAWLRQILARSLADEVRKFATAKRNVELERSLQAAVDQSSSRLEAYLGADQSTPSEQAVRQEQLLQLAEAISKLTVDERRAVELHRLQGRSLAQVATELDRSKAAVAGLLHRGMEKLRQSLSE